ncbi:MAG: hypothetical protein GXP24_11890 [Planctomycetes bacterium]|nr:hypothetical protein [Planctomycetota bacterium]
MDTSDYPSLPNLSQLHARLAANSRHVEAVIDSQLDGIERLFSATTAQDWQAVAKASHYLAELQSDQVGPDVVREARHVFEELSHAADGAKQPKHKQPKHLASLLAACRNARKS